MVGDFYSKALMFGSANKLNFIIVSSTRVSPFLSSSLLSAQLLPFKLYQQAHSATLVDFVLLGHGISKDGILPVATKLRAVADFQHLRP